MSDSLSGPAKPVPIVAEYRLVNGIRPRSTVKEASSLAEKGRGLTKVQRVAITELCSCFHEEASAKGYLSDEPTFPAIMAELIDPENVFSRTHADIKIILGRHGQSLR